MYSWSNCHPLMGCSLSRISRIPLAIEVFAHHVFDAFEFLLDPSIAHVVHTSDFAVCHLIDIAIGEHFDFVFAKALDEFVDEYAFFALVCLLAW